MSAFGDAHRFLSWVPELIEAGQTGGQVDGFSRVDPFSYDGVVCLVARPGLRPDHGYPTITQEVVGSLLDPGTGFMTVEPHLARVAHEDDLDERVADVFAWHEGDLPIVSTASSGDEDPILDETDHAWRSVLYALTATRGRTGPISRRRPPAIEGEGRPQIEWGGWETFARVLGGCLDGWEVETIGDDIAWRRPRKFFARRFTLVSKVPAAGVGPRPYQFNVHGEGHLVFDAKTKEVIRPRGLRAHELTSALVVEVLAGGSPARAVLPRVDQVNALIDRVLLPSLAR